jgi:hypothetical protein
MPIERRHWHVQQLHDKLKRESEAQKHAADKIKAQSKRRR